MLASIVDVWTFGCVYKIDHYLFELLQVMLTINVTDVNDNRPVFNIPPGGYQSSVSEDAFVGDEVITVVAMDLDSSNQFITYAIDTNVTGVSVPFTILDPTVRLPNQNKMGIHVTGEISGKSSAF